MTKLRRLWMNGILHTIKSLYQLMLVSNPPSDELRTDVLVGLFSLARSYNLDDPVCALAGLPITPRLQDSLYTTDPLPVLTRNITELFSSPKTTENPEIAQAYLTVLLSLVQTTHSSMNWTANSLVPLLEPGGILSHWDTFQGDILELVICIHIHVRVRSGFLLPADFTNRIPDVIANCTKPLHRQLLIEASLILSVMDKGHTLEGLAMNGTRQAHGKILKHLFILYCRTHASIVIRPRSRTNTFQYDPKSTETCSKSRSELYFRHRCPWYGAAAPNAGHTVLTKLESGIQNLAALL